MDMKTDNPKVGTDVRLTYSSVKLYFFFDRISKHEQKQRCVCMVVYVFSSLFKTGYLKSKHGPLISFCLFLGFTFFSS